MTNQAKSRFLTVPPHCSGQKAATVTGFPVFSFLCCWHLGALGQAISSPSIPHLLLPRPSPKLLDACGVLWCPHAEKPKWTSELTGSGSRACCCCCCCMGLAVAWLIRRLPIRLGSIRPQRVPAVNVETRKEHHGFPPSCATGRCESVLAPCVQP